MTIHVLVVRAGNIQSEEVWELDENGVPIDPELQAPAE